tara:strand:- start:590 stop:1654 length:1065 start_codon:yes stop_codon:yes gene_type:complete
MGFFSKLWKGIKKPFKAIGKAVKSAFKSFGKLVNKAGILGQVAMFFILPGIANMALGALGSTFTGLAASLAGSTATGVMGSLARGAGWVMQKAGQFAGTVKAGFKTVTGAVTEFFGATGRYIGGKLGLKTAAGAVMPNLSVGEAWGQYSKAMVNNFDAFVGKGAEFLGTSSVAATAGAVPLPSTAPVATTTLQDPKALESVMGKTPDFTQSLQQPVGYPGGAAFPAAVESQSLLSRAGSYITDLPGRAKDYVTSGDMGRDALAKAEAMPGAIATSMVTGKLMEMINPAEEYEAKTPWGSNAGTYRSSQAIQASQVDDYTSYAYQYTSGTSPDGMWGGAVNTKNYYDNYMQQFAA